MTTTFADLGVPRRIVASLAERGIENPFPIQALTLADNLAGRDVSGRAPTGSGKTLAFGIPLVIDCPRAEPRRPRRLVLVPTRELATQVAQELKHLAGRKGPRIATFFGGTNLRSDDRVLDRGVDIAVACPGRLTDLLQQRLVRLDDVETVVLDEADRMADMGFLPQVRKLLDLCRSDRQTVLFSATLDGDVDVLVTRYQHDPVRHELELPEEELPDLTHIFWDVERTERVAIAGQVISRMGPTVVFCRTKRGADRVAKQLGNAGVSAAAIHGDRSQNQRDRALEDFRSGRAAALVATDVAARGIHVDDVAAVIHFDPPEDHKDYVHRSGRTARAGARGVVVSLVIAEKVSMVKGLQKALDLPSGTGPVDLDALGEPVRGAARPATVAPSNRRSRSEARKDRRTNPDGRRDTRTNDTRTNDTRTNDTRTNDTRTNDSRTNDSRSGERRSTNDSRSGERRSTNDSRSNNSRSNNSRSGERRSTRERDDRGPSETADSPRRRRHRKRHADDPRRSDRSDGAGASRGTAPSGGSRSAGSRSGVSRSGVNRSGGSRSGGGRNQNGAREQNGSRNQGSSGRSERRGSAQASRSRASSRGPRR